MWGMGKTRHMRLARAVVGAVFGAFAVAWAGWAWARPDFVPLRFGVVEAGKLYRCGRATPGALARTIEEYGIRTVVDFGAWEEGSVEEERERRTAEAMGVRRVVLRLEGDGRGDPNMYAEAMRIVSDARNQPVLFHCSAGTERTGCAVMMYRHVYQNVGLREAYREAQAYDHSPTRNVHLWPVAEGLGATIKKALADGTRVPAEVGFGRVEP